MSVGKDYLSGPLPQQLEGSIDETVSWLEENKPAWTKHFTDKYCRENGLNAAILTDSQYELLRAAMYAAVFDENTPEGLRTTKPILRPISDDEINAYQKP